MKLDLVVIAKSDKHTGYCVAAMDKKGSILNVLRLSDIIFLQRGRNKEWKCSPLATHKKAPKSFSD